MFVKIMERLKKANLKNKAKSFIKDILIGLKEGLITGTIVYSILIVSLIFMIGNDEEISQAITLISTTSITISGIIIGFSFLLLAELLKRIQSLSENEIGMLKYNLMILKRFLWVIIVSFINLVISNMPSSLGIYKNITILFSLSLLFAIIFGAFNGIFMLIKFIKRIYPNRVL